MPLSAPAAFSSVVDDCRRFAQGRDLLGEHMLIARQIAGKLRGLLRHHPAKRRKMMAKAKVTTMITARTRGTLTLRRRSKSGVSTKLNRMASVSGKQDLARDIERADDDRPDHQPLKQRGAAVRT